MKVIYENLERCQAFYKSDLYNFLLKNDPDSIDKIFSILCKDPDSSDSELYQELGKKYDLSAEKSHLVTEIEGQKIRLAADIICGRKQIVEYYKKRNKRKKCDNQDAYVDFECWKEDYEKVRTNLNLHFLWPKHKAPTINTYRYMKYLDRIDCLLFDLKSYFEGKETPMKEAYCNGTTPLWLRQFNDFPDFINKMKLNAFVDKANNVLDISIGEGTILNKLYSRQEVEKTLFDYMDNMLHLFLEQSRKEIPCPQNNFGKPTSK